MKLDVEAARRAIHDKVAVPLGVEMLEAAWGINKSKRMRQSWWLTANAFLAQFLAASAGSFLVALCPQLDAREARRPLSSFALALGHRGVASFLATKLVRTQHVTMLRLDGALTSA